MWKRLFHRWGGRASAPPGDFPTLVSALVAVFALTSVGVVSSLLEGPEALSSSLEAGGGRRGWGWVTTRSPDTGRDLRRSSSLDAQRQLVDERAEERWCIDASASVWLARPCDEATWRHQLWFSSNELRRRAGEPACWWHASVEDVERIRGVTWTWAALAVKLRNEGLAPTLEQLSLHPEMGSRGRRIAAALTEACAHEAHLGTRAFGRR